MSFSAKENKPLVQSFIKPSDEPVRDIDLTPMINVVFLLLTFFMIAGVFRTIDEIALSPPATHIGLTQQENTTAEVSIDAEGRVLINGNSFALEQLNDALRALDNDGAPLIVRADSSALGRRVVEVLSVARAVGFKEVGLQAIGKSQSVQP